jgi:flavin reductase (DIM6/NTAB) family NADH-FMN oxidoreductase RutF
MTMGWHMVMEFDPSLIGCYIWSENHSLELIRRSKACVINIPNVDLGSKVAGIGNASGRSVDKFAKFDLTPVPAATVDAPLIELRSTSFAAIRSTWSSWSTSGNRRLTRAAAT